MPNIHINHMAILIVVVANFVFGFLWYTPLFGKAWAKELGMNMDQRPPTWIFVRGMIFNLLGNFFLAFVLAHNIAAWNPMSWGHDTQFMSPTRSIMSSAIFTWLGFFLPVDINTVAWEGKSWKFFFINTTYHLISLFIASAILVSMQ